jgi:hypothetical protein
MHILPDIIPWDPEDDKDWRDEAVRDFEKNPALFFREAAKRCIDDHAKTDSSEMLGLGAGLMAMAKAYEKPRESAPVLDDKWGSAIGVLLCVIFIAACIGDNINHNPMFVIIGASVFIMARCMSRSEPIRARYYRALERHESKQPTE